jgi:hypothetical protein
MFSVQVWGMLEHLCLLANLIYRLGLLPRICGIASEGFWKAMESGSLDLCTFIKTPPVAEWIETLSAVRHAGAHRNIPVPTTIRQHTERSQLPKEEILAKILAEDSDARELLTHPLLDPEMRPAVEEQLVSNWRLKNTEEIADHMVLLKSKRGEYFYSPVISIDSDLKSLTQIMDRFFEAFLRQFG